MIPARDPAHDRLESQTLQAISLQDVEKKTIGTMVSTRGNFHNLALRGMQLGMDSKALSFPLNLRIINFKFRRALNPFAEWDFRFRKE